MRIAPGASIAIHTKPHHPQAAGLAQELALWLQQRGYQPQINGDPENEDSAVAGLGLWGPQAGASTSGARGFAALGPAPVNAAIPALAVLLGGDGTMLHVAPRLAASNTPILAVHLGTLGFLTETALADLYPSLETILAGGGSRQRRALLHAELDRDGAVF